MSYDLRIWCLKTLPKVEEGTAEAGTGWLVNVSPGTFALEEMPEEVNEKFTSIRHVVDLSLEPSSAPAAGRDALWRVARRIATIAQGVIEDPQSGSLEVPAAVVLPRRESRARPKPLGKRRRGLSQAEVEARLNTPEMREKRAKW